MFTAIRRRLVVLSVLVLVAILVTSGVGYILSELGRTNMTLQRTEATLRATHATLLETQATLATTQTHLQDRTAILNETKVALSQTTSEFVAERTVRNQLQLDKSGLQADKDALTASLHTATRENATLTADLASAVSLQLELRTDLKNTEAEKADIEAQHQRLQLTAGTIVKLETKTRDLQSEIAELEDRRRPLILASNNVVRSGFLCTGSMEPTITCLDEATWLPNVRPEDIAVGTTITFDPSCREDDANGRGTAHRVIDIRVEGGIYYYWPKGDGNHEPDGCWVPHTNVEGYVIEIHKDVRPANAVLRERVNAASATYDTARTALEAARGAYLDLIESYCGHRIPAQCRLAPGSYARAIAAHDKYLRVSSYYSTAATLWKCWIRNARESEYPGHIPYLCGPPPPPV